MKRTLIWLTVASLSAATALAADNGKDNDDEKPAPEEMVELAGKIEPAMIVAELTLRYDKGQAPGGGGVGRYSRYSGSGGMLIEEERPMEVPGFLLDKATAIIEDPAIHPRFIQGVAVRFGDEVAPAKMTAYGQDQPAVFLTLEKPLAKAKPLSFPADAGEAAYAIRRSRRGDTWTVRLGPVTRGVILERGRKPFMLGGGLFLDEDGKCVGMSMTGRLYLDGSWKGSPLKWPKVSAAKMDKLLADAKRRTEAGLLRVQLNFRSPKKDVSSLMSRFRRGDEGSATEQNVIGVLVAPKRVLVLANMDPKLTARLERITVHPAKGKPVSGTFLHTLKAYGGLVVELNSPLPDPVALSDKDIMGLEDTLLASARIILHEEEREVYYLRRRITGYDLGWKKQVYPEFPGSGEGVFLFDREGKLLVLPIARRRKVSSQQRYGGDSPIATASSYLADVLADLAGENIDTANVPLTEQEENRLAWIGVELQPMNPKLARINNVADLTKGGETGAMVSYVYPDSPAAKAGIEPQDILLRVHLAGNPKPLDVHIAGDSGFPWDRAWAQLDEIPVQAFERFPHPWPTVENTLTRALTDNGFGTKYTAEFFRDGKVFKKDFTVLQSPAHYDTAERFKSEPLGMTTRDLTYEVRRYFQRLDTDPGVIVSKVEPGSRAATAGLKPYEIVTHVNDQPVTSAKQFEKLTQGQTELRLSVRRMTRGRIVKIQLPAHKVAATSRPAED